MKCKHFVQARSIIGYIHGRYSPASKNILARLVVTYYMADVLRKRTGRKAVRKLEPRLSSNVGSYKRTAETQTMAAALVQLTTKEAQLLQFLAENPGRIFSRDSLLKMIWGYADGVTPRTVDVHIQRLREKLKGNRVLKIHTIFRRGYVLEHPGKLDVTV